MKDHVDQMISSMSMILMIAGLLTTSIYPASYITLAGPPHPLFGNANLPDWFHALNAISYACLLLAIAASLAVILQLNKLLPEDSLRERKSQDVITGSLYSIACCSFHLALAAAAIAIVLGVTFLISNQRHAAVATFVIVICIIFLLFGAVFSSHWRRTLPEEKA